MQTKRCPECGTNVPVSKIICSCSHYFKLQPQVRVAAPIPKAAESAVVEKEIKVYAEGGKGKKQCKNCKKFVGIRSSVCACGSSFQVAVRVSEAQEKEPLPATVAMSDVQSGFRFNICDRKIRVLAPAGSCPHRLSGTDAESIDEWVVKVRNTFGAKREFLTMKGVIYFVRHFYDMSSSEYKAVKDHIVRTLSDEQVA
jgi:hypothetical protein